MWGQQNDLGTGRGGGYISCFGGVAFKAQMTNQLVWDTYIYKINHVLLKAVEVLIFMWQYSAEMI